MDPKAMQKLSYGLFVLTAKTGEKLNGCITNTAIQVTTEPINGCITNTAIQVTTEPNQIAFAVNKANLTHDMVKESGRFVISIISEKAEFSRERNPLYHGRNQRISGRRSRFRFRPWHPYIICLQGHRHGSPDRGRVRHLCLLSRQHQAQAPGSQKDRRRQGHLALHDLRL